MDWDEAKEACENLNDGWRLPNIEELKVLYVHRDIIGKFIRGGKYWSISEYWGEESRAWNQSFSAWKQDFFDGNQICEFKNSHNIARAVRSKK